MKIIFVLLLSFPQYLMARTIFEPSLSASSGTYKGDISKVGLSSVDATFATLAAGVRYGITRDYIHVTAVADAYFTKLDSSKIESSTSFQGNIGVGIGYEWNIPIRTYIILGVPTSSVEVSYYFSESFIIGLRYNRMSMEIKDPLNNNKGDINLDTFGVALSFPFEFDYPSHWWRKKDWE